MAVCSSFTQAQTPAPPPVASCDQVAVAVLVLVNASLDSSPFSNSLLFFPLFSFLFFSEVSFPSHALRPFRLLARIPSQPRPKSQRVLQAWDHRRRSVDACPSRSPPERRVGVTARPCRRANNDELAVPPSEGARKAWVG